jgi:hypothetical protein
MGAWETAVDIETMAKIMSLVASYDNEAELIADLENFGGDVLEILNAYNTIQYGTNPKL